LERHHLVENMNNVQRLYEILDETTQQFRKEGDDFEKVEEHAGGAIKVITLNMNPPVDKAPDNLEKVDLEFLVVGVDKAAAEKCKPELVEILKSYPDLVDGPSYISVGAEIGDQGAAFQLFALGKVLNLWGIVTPRSLGVTDEAKIQEMIGSGLIMITGFRP
jgi:hypothetical protein